MWPINLTPNQRPAYLAASASASTMTRVEANLLNLDHKHLYSLDSMFEDGQVNFNRGEDIPLSLQAAFVDPSDDLLELDLRHLLEVRHHLYVPSLEVWAVTPMFTGRVMAPSSDGDISTVEAHGKETFGLMPGAPRRTWQSGRRVAGAIRAMFEDIGETRFRISRGLNATLKSDVHSGGADEDKCPTRVARRMAARAGYQWFFDQQGYMVLRRPPKTPMLTWSEETDSTLLSGIKFSRDLRTIRNVVKATGKKGIAYTAVADPDHVFSPQSLKRGGVLGRLTAYLQAEEISERADLRRAAEARLDSLLVDNTDAQFECIPARHVGPFDRVRAEKRNGRFGEFFPSEGSVPLSNGNMTVGVQNRVRSQSAGRVRIG